MTFKEKLSKQVETREGQIAHLRAALRESTDEAEKSAIEETIDKIIEEMNDLKELIVEADEPADESASRAFNPLSSMSFGGNFTNENTTKRGENRMNENEIRSLQKFVVNGGRGMTEAEQRALNISGAAAVIPTEIYNEIITGEKYSDLLHRAKVFNEGGAGKMYIPIASNTAASWHEENATGSEAAPALTKIELGGFELMRLMTMSAASASMTAQGFEQSMLQLLSAEVVETLEKSFIDGDGNGKPRGLAALTWNEANTVTASGAISFKDIASGISKLPQKYARNAIILCNSDTAFNTISAADDTNGAPIFNIGDGQTVLGREVVISEHMPANTIYIVDPRELYVRFAMPIQIEADRSSGFTSASINLRALCVVDAAWNAAAAVKIVVG